MQAAWVDRKGSPWEPFAGDPDLTISDFHDLVATLSD